MNHNEQQSVVTHCAHCAMVVSILKIPSFIPMWHFKHVLDPGRLRPLLMRTALVLTLMATLAGCGMFGSPGEAPTPPPTRTPVPTFTATPAIPPEPATAPTAPAQATAVASIPTAAVPAATLTAGPSPTVALLPIDTPAGESQTDGDE